MIMLESRTYVEKVEFLIIFEILMRLGIVKRSFTCLDLHQLIETLFNFDANLIFLFFFVPVPLSDDEK